MKKQEKTPGERGNLRNLPDKQFKELLIIRMLIKFENWIEELKENLNKELESIKNNKADLNKIITEKKAN